MSGRLEMTVSRLAEVLRLDRRRVKAAADGLEPVCVEGNRKFYDLADVVRAVFAKGGIEGEKLRLTAARADAAELDLAVQRGELVAAADVEAAALAHGRRVREAVQNWAAQVSPGLAADLGIDAAALQIAIEREARGLLERVAGNA